jgi:hypothetical protein
MAADLSIHVITPDFTESDYAAMKSSTFGSKFFTGMGRYRDDLFMKAADTPQVSVGEVSWLKAALSGDDEEYVPGPVMKVHEIIGEEFPIVDDELIARLRDALDAPNTTGYHVATADEVCEFLEEHRGAKLFTVSW